MGRLVRCVLVVLLLGAGALTGAGVAVADFEGSDGANQQEGNNSATTVQGGSSVSGDAVGGQVTGIVSSGEASVDATNRSEDVDVESGGSFGDNFADSFVGHSFQSASVVVQEDFEGSTAFNQQEGDNTVDIAQAANASSGDGIGGQVIGVVTSATGSADIVADNASEDVDVDSGEAFAFNTAFMFAGLDYLALVEDAAADFEDSTSGNQQDGDNSASIAQTNGASTGDAVAGQVVGAVSAGDAQVDARNRSEDVDVESGEAFADNSTDSFVGLEFVSVDVDVSGADFEGSDAINQQEGDNALDAAQASEASTGDAVGGQIIGAVTSAAGSADIVADNASTDTDVETGLVSTFNFAGSFVGLEAASVSVNVSGADFEFSTATANQQDGNNSTSIAQSVVASTGDGVGGQVIGVVSAGDTQVDGRNRSEDVDVETGDAFAGNSADSFTGLEDVSVDEELTADFEGSSATNQQEGDNVLSLAQTADASTGDGVAGQIIGAVTTATGSADIVADNASAGTDVETGDAFADNFAASFVGLEFLSLNVSVTLTDFEDSAATNQQDGDNALDITQDTDAASGDGVGGQVIGAVTAGDAQVDARNRSEDVDVESGEAFADSFALSFVGLSYTTADFDIGFGPQDFDGSIATNQQDGDNVGSVSQTAGASTGDAVGGQVVGVVTSAGGSADAVLDNATVDVDVETGGSAFDTSGELFVGLRFGTEPLFFGGTL